jgi:hypothetical protein
MKYRKTGKKRVVYGFDYSKGRWWFSLEHFAYKHGKWPVWIMVAASSLTAKYADLLDGLPEDSNEVEKILKTKFRKYELVHALSLGTHSDWYLGVPTVSDPKHLKHDFCRV